MITESMIYWITRLTGIKIMLVASGLLILLLGVSCSVAWYSTWCREHERDEFRKQIKHPILMTFVGLILLLSSLFVPTTKQACAIKVIPVIVNNKEVQELPNKVVELANEWIEELKPNKSTESK